MKLVTKWLTRGTLGAALALSACSGSDAQGPGAQAASVNEAPQEFTHLGVIRQALDSVTLRPEQKTQIDELGTAAKARHESIRVAHVAWRSALADQIAAGKIDRAALKPQIDALAAAALASAPADRAALVRLHDILDKVQRDQFVSALESAMHSRMRMMHERGGGPRQWAADLKLTEAQQDQIRTALRDQMHHDGEGHRGHAGFEQGKKLLASFREDQFTLDANSAPLLGHDRAVFFVDRMIDTASVAVPLLSPEQRAIAAQKIRTEPLHP